MSDALNFGNVNGFCFVRLVRLLFKEFVDGLQIMFQFYLKACERLHQKL
jgi:hypothetical protein